MVAQVVHQVQVDVHNILYCLEYISLCHPVCIDLCCQDGNCRRHMHMLDNMYRVDVSGRRYVNNNLFHISIKQSNTWLEATELLKTLNTERSCYCKKEKITFRRQCWSKKGKNNWDVLQWVKVHTVYYTALTQTRNNLSRFTTDTLQTSDLHNAKGYGLWRHISIALG